jgi:hypothetical protein
VRMEMIKAQLFIGFDLLEETEGHAWSRQRQCELEEDIHLQLLPCFAFPEAGMVPANRPRAISGISHRDRRR